MTSESNIAEYIPYLIILLTAISSFVGFSNGDYFDRYKFSVGAILGKSKQWDRLVTSSFLHGDYMHLLFNMMTLYFFSTTITNYLGVWQYLTIYFAAVIGGGLLSLWMHRREYYYTAIGASGGVVGVLFASIALYPHMGIYMFFIPIPIPGWIFGILYLGYSVYGMRTRQGNVGHDAHLGGAFIGLVLALVFAPYQLLMHNALYIGIMVVPMIALAYYVWKNKD